MLQVPRRKIPYNWRYLPFLKQGWGLSFPSTGFYFLSSCSAEHRSLFDSHGIDCTYFFKYCIFTSREKQQRLAPVQLEIHRGLNIIQCYVFIDCILHYHLCICGVWFMDGFCKGFKYKRLQLIFIPPDALQKRIWNFPSHIRVLKLLNFIIQVLIVVSFSQFMVFFPTIIFYPLTHLFCVASYYCSQ